ncbi:MAG: hypothetical protein EBV07_00720 [Proteobacteria bacterium]|nr:hypothetical protein [Pseudomonadota bacterium]
MKNTFTKISFFKIIFFIFLSIFLNSRILAADPCDRLDLLNGDPKELVKCANPSDLNISTEGRSLFEIIMLINNTLGILAIFLSIIGVIVGAIYLAKAQSEKKSIQEAKTIISNSFLAFFIAAALWLIVSLVLNSLGVGSLIPIVKPQ